MAVALGGAADAVAERIDGGAAGRGHASFSARNDGVPKAPGRPAEPAKSNDAPKPADTSKPGDAAKPGGASKPAEAGKPADQAKPADVGTPADPTKPAGRSDPALSAPSVPPALTVPQATPVHVAPADPKARPDQPPRGAVAPIPSTGAVPPMYDPSSTSDARAMALRADARGYRRQIASIAHRCFGSKRSDRARAEGIAELREFTDPAAFRVMVDVLAREGADVQLALYEHLASQGADGQSALAYAAIRQGDSRLRDDAISRLVRPPSDDVLREIDFGLRSDTHAVANAAGFVAGQLNALGAIPLLIFTQATEDRVGQAGDLAWIAIGTQISYVANVVPVVGGSAGAFQPVLGVVNQGTLLRVMDAVAVTYRIDVHNSLVAMTSADWGQSTAGLGYNMKEWWTWFNETYVPFKREQSLAAELAKSDPGSP
ncbi:MAG: hypothetical protein U0575_06800 [Phycisphaerales bacterium]